METVLSPTERRQLMTVLQDLDPMAPAEKRRTPRRKVLNSLWIRQVAQGTTKGLRKAMMINVSTQGVGFLSHRRLVAGDKFLLPLKFAEGGGWLVLCEVRNCTESRTGQFKIGARFIDRIEDNDGNARVPGDWLASDN